MSNQHTLNVEIAETLEKIQGINPDLYSWWYSKLYPPLGSNGYWNTETLTRLNSIIDRTYRSTDLGDGAVVIYVPWEETPGGTTTPKPEGYDEMYAEFGLGPLVQ